MLQRSLVLALLGAIFALTPLAYSSPPDDTWIGGLYDDDYDYDYDDVILLITSGVCVVQSDPLCSLSPVWMAVRMVVSTDSSFAYSPPQLHRDPRAPPLA